MALGKNLGGELQTSSLQSFLGGQGKKYKGQ